MEGPISYVIKHETYPNWIFILGMVYVFVCYIGYIFCGWELHGKLRSYALCSLESQHIYG
jgi:hypothetical protein